MVMSKSNCETPNFILYTPNHFEKKIIFENNNYFLIITSYYRDNYGNKICIGEAKKKIK